MIFFYSWGGNSELNVESLIMILSSSSLASLSPPSFVALTSLLLQVSARELHNNLVSATKYGGLKEARDEDFYEGL